MLTIHLGATELFDDEKSEFYMSTDGPVVELEHSLVSLSKWESKWKKPFLGDNDKSPEEVIDYVRCMILDPIFSPEELSKLSEQNFKEIQEYINDPMTATWFSKNQPKARGRQIITAELIYYWMNTAGVPFEAQYWHLNKLITLIKIHDEKSGKPKKRSAADIAREQHELNERRKAQFGTRG